MKKHILSMMSVLSALVMTSCFQQEITINLKKDGSGTLVVEETYLRDQMIGDFESQLDSEDAAKERAAQFGEGVTLVKFEPVTAGTAEGVRATYRFTDINKLRINAEGKTMNDPEEVPDGAEPAEEVEKPITFIYKDGTLAKEVAEKERGAVRVPRARQAVPRMRTVNLGKAKGESIKAYPPISQGAFWLKRSLRDASQGARQLTVGSISILGMSLGRGTAEGMPAKVRGRLLAHFRPNSVSTLMPPTRMASGDP